MAVTKTRTTITQRTTTGQSTTIDIANAYRSGIYVEHNNGTGTITAGATMQLQIRPEGGTQYFNYGGIMTGSLTASLEETWYVPLPDDAGDVRIDYVVPVGSSGHTLDAEIGEITAI